MKIEGRSSRCAGYSAAILATCALAGVGTSARPLHAGTWDDRPKILLHLAPAGTGPGAPGQACGAGQVPGSCAGIVTAGEADAMGVRSTYIAYLVVALGDLRHEELGGTGRGLAGLQCGIHYDSRPNSGVDIFQWTLCADMEFPSAEWPASCSGNLITWNRETHCQLGELAVAGYFYLSAYSRDVLSVEPRPVDGIAKVADCTAAEQSVRWIEELGSIGFSAGGVETGFNPCDYARTVDPAPGETLSPICAPTPVETTTWGRLKAHRR